MLTLEEKIEFLREGIFGNLDDETRTTVAQRMGERNLANEEPLFLNGEPGDEIFIIISGGIEIHLGEHVVVVLGQGQIFGEMAVLGGGQRTASARAKGETHLLFLKDKAVRLLFQQAPDLAFAFFKVICDRLEEANHVAQFLFEERKEYGVVEVVSGELEGQTFPLYHEGAPLGCSRGGVVDVLRIALPVTKPGLLERHVSVSISGDSVFVEPLDGEVVVDGNVIEDSMAVGPEDTVEIGGLGVRFRLK